jgi:hypothetical protein
MNIVAQYYFAPTPPGGLWVNDHFLVRFQLGLTSVDECYATIDGCFIVKNIA